LLGYFFGRGYDTIMKVFNYIGNTLLILILAAALAAYLVLRVREHRQLETELDEIAVEEGGEGESGAGGSND
jgi:membrane protein DedA with SNARE-associated domain